MKIPAEDLRLVRSHMDLTQAEMAQHLGVSTRTIVNWETSGVPESKEARVLKMIGNELSESRHIEALSRSYWESGASFPASDEWIEEQAEQVRLDGPVRFGPSESERRSRLLSPFTDIDLTDELRDRALRRGLRASRWNAARVERYQKFISPEWGDLDSGGPSLSEAEITLAARDSDDDDEAEAQAQDG